MKRIWMAMAVAALLGCPPAGAVAITFKWETPTKRTDGKPLPKSEILNYRIKRGGNTIAKPTASATSATLEGFEYGVEYCFTMATRDKLGDQLYGPDTKPVCVTKQDEARRSEWRPDSPKILQLQPVP